MLQNLDLCLQSVLKSEGGFVDLASDPGGATNFGVTQRTLAAWRHRPVTVDDVKGLGLDEVKDIYEAQYAKPISFDQLPSGLDLVILDSAVNSGPGRAARILQETLGMTGTDVDGIIGAHTLAAISNFPDRNELIEVYCTARLDFMQQLSNWSTFGTGWTARVKRVQADAIAMTRGRATPVDQPALPPEAQVKASGAVKVTATRSGKAALVNIGTTIAAVVVSAGGAASQAAPVLAPYASVEAIRYTLLGLTVVSAAGTFVVAWTRAKAGGTT